MKIFPLSIAGKVVLVLIAAMLGLIWWKMKKFVDAGKAKKAAAPPVQQKR
jgi:hypothetical protein